MPAPLEGLGAELDSPVLVSDWLLGVLSTQIPLSSPTRQGLYRSVESQLIASPGARRLSREVRGWPEPGSGDPSIQKSQLTNLFLYLLPGPWGLGPAQRRSTQES